ncbi:MAG: hypothetical protein JSR60_01720 [Proteobacteria bacterium]|nr:hypothetical protein [Pseudomonadota bacterium]
MRYGLAGFAMAIGLAANGAAGEDLSPEGVFTDNGHYAYIGPKGDGYEVEFLSVPDRSVDTKVPATVSGNHVIFTIPVTAPGAGVYEGDVTLAGFKGTWTHVKDGVRMAEPMDWPRTFPAPSPPR